MVRHLGAQLPARCPGGSKRPVQCQILPWIDWKVLWRVRLHQRKKLRSSIVDTPGSIGGQVSCLFLELPLTHTLTAGLISKEIDATSATRAVKRDPEFRIL